MEEQSICNDLNVLGGTLWNSGCFIFEILFEIYSISYIYIYIYIINYFK